MTWTPSSCTLACTTWIFTSKHVDGVDGALISKVKMVTKRILEVNPGCIVHHCGNHITALVSTDTHSLKITLDSAKYWMWPIQREEACNAKQSNNAKVCFTDYHYPKNICTYCYWDCYTQIIIYNNHKIWLGEYLAIVCSEAPWTLNPVLNQITEAKSVTYTRSILLSLYLFYVGFL